VEQASFIKSVLRNHAYARLRHWPLVIALPQFALVLSYLQYLYVDGAFIWWARSTFYNAFSFAFCFVPISLLIISAWFLRLIAGKNSTRSSLLSAGISLVLLVWVNLSMCAITAFTFFGDYRYHDTARFDDHVFRLDSEWKVGVGGDSRTVFSLLKCDRIGLICEIVYLYEYINEDGSLPISDHEYRAIEASLVPDSQAHSISMEIDGQSMHTQLLKPK